MKNWDQVAECPARIGNLRESAQPFFFLIFARVHTAQNPDPLKKRLRTLAESHNHFLSLTLKVTFLKLLFRWGNTYDLCSVVVQKGSAHSGLNKTKISVKYHFFNLR